MHKPLTENAALIRKTKNVTEQNKIVIEHGAVNTNGALGVARVVCVVCVCDLYYLATCD